ncbi:MAG: hypothetical protein ACJ744_08610 [Gaiellaceae bacterium]|jgi:hypothetical protein
MSRTLALTISAAALSVAALASAAAAQRQAPLLTLPRAATAGQQTQFGRISSLNRVGARYIMRFDAAWLLSGYPAQRAKLEDTGSGEVPNDLYVVDETHRLLSYVVPAGTPVTVLTHGTNTTSIPVAALARRVRTGQEKSVGFWLLIGNKYPTPVLSVDQQYRP